MTSTFSDFPGFDKIVTALPNVGVIGFNDSGSNSGASRPSKIGVPPDSASARNIFASTQSSEGIDFHSHEAIRMLLNYMKKIIPDKDNGWESTTVQLTLFPNFAADSAPDSLSVGGLDENRVTQGGCALLIKAFYNACGDWDDKIDLDKANQFVADLNTHIQDQKISIFIQYYRWAYAMSPSDELVNKYKTLLLSTAYRNLKVAQANSGSWNNSNLEMFCHFIKLAACGASDDNIGQIYNALVQPTDGTQAVDGSYFSQITPSTWRQFSGWLSSGLLDFSDIEASNLDSHYEESQGVSPKGDPRPPARIELWNLYTSWTGYRKSDSSSCFSGSTLVLMASGGLKSISEIKVGELVATMPNSGSAKVIFVSKPLRGRRSLYSFKDLPDIKFTDTHPFITESKQPRFVKSLLASSMNPTWRLFICSDIESESVKEEIADKDSNELLYDLVFEKNVDISNGGFDLPTYVVGDGKGKFLTTVSEAPIAGLLRLEATFVQHVMEEVREHGKRLEDLFGLLESDTSFACQMMQELASKVEFTDGSAPSMSELTLENCLTDDNQGQVAAGFIEKLFSRVGRLPTNIVSTGWIGYPSRPDQDTREVLILRRLQILNTNVPGPEVDLPKDWHVRIWREKRLVFDSTVSTNLEGPTTLVFQQALDIDVKGSKDSTFVSFEFSALESGRDLVLVGQGKMIKYCDIWINLINVKFGSATPLQAAIQVEIQHTTHDAFNKRNDWKDIQMQTMAAMLGRRFGAGMLERAAQLTVGDSIASRISG